MDEVIPRRRRRRRRRASAGGPAPGLAPRSPVPAHPVTPSEPEPADSAAGEQVWERTHLEQTMFALAREHADAAARSAQQTPPDAETEQTHSLVAVLMAFLAIEAFINMVGADRLGPRYRYYDRMPPEGKWTEVTRLVSKSGKTFAEDGPEIRALSTLRTWRNMLTHYKGEYEDVQQAGRGGETRVGALLSSANAARSVDIARMLFRAFYEFDRRSAPRQFVWLDDRPHQGRQASARTAAARAAAPADASAPRAESPASVPRPSRRRRR